MKRAPVWLFDLDDTLHDASHAAFGPIAEAMTVSSSASWRWPPRGRGPAPPPPGPLRRDAVGLMRSPRRARRAFARHAPAARPEHWLRASAHDLALERRRAGRFILTNAPRAYAERACHGGPGMTRLFHGVIPIERMTMFGDLRPRSDARMLRSIAVTLKVPPLALHPGRGYAGAPEVGAPGGHEDDVDAALMRRAGSPTAPVSAGLLARPRRCRRPTYACARIRSLQALSRPPW